MNLGYALESAGRFDEAIATYRTALEVQSGHMPTIQALARLQVVEDKVDSQTCDLLKEIALRGEDDDWRDWAQLELAKRRGN
ncbi:hypothetical protein KDL67_05525 [bacterium]|nr:hypothetical protein [bacterium]